MLKWTQSARSTQLLWLPVPASTSVPLLLFALHIRLWTFLLALVVCVGMVVLRSKGRTMVWVVRRFAGKLGGEIMYSRSIWYRRRMQRTYSFDLMNIHEIRNSHI